MDLKLFLIMAVILIGILKEVKKANRQTRTGNPSPGAPTPWPDSPTPLPDATEEPPMTEAWNFPKPFEHVPMPTLLKRKNKKARAQHAVSEHAVPRNNSPKAVHQPIAPPQEIPAVANTETADHEEDFQIRSAEEARKAIIWGEILQRKY